MTARRRCTEFLKDVWRLKTNFLTIFQRDVDIVFLYAKNDQYKVVELEFKKSEYFPPTVDILQFDHKRLKLEDDMKITYDEKPCQVYVKTVCTNII